MTSSPHGSYTWGYTHATMGADNAWRRRKPERIVKSALSADRGLQLAPVKAELLVTAGQHTAVNTFPGLVHTARHVMGVGNA